MYMLNLGSLVLGLIAWILPIMNLIQHKKQNHKNWAVLAVISFSACAVSLCFQLMYSNHLVKIEDWSALMDTAGAVVFVSTVLVGITILLNGITLVVYRGRAASGQ
jgi:hypothetical protein